jgi:hypothetical protein
MSLSQGKHKDALTPEESARRAHQRKLDYYQRHKAKILIERKRRWDTDPAWQARQLELKRDSLLRTRYGISRSEYHAMLEAQGGGCGICGTKEPGNGKGDKYFDVDHCHTTGKVRALLCRNCNVTVGVIEKKSALIKLIHEYLKRHQ